ncbi:MAG: acyl-CoA thioester hydrolase/BAAT C-terminal domain-containing protein [Gemmatales bacterium]
MLALNYFAYPHEAIKGVPDKHFDIKLEIFPGIREWMKTRPELDQKKISLYGVSKGAEFALLAASQYDWIAKVVAVVPSDIVWEGYSGDVVKKSSHSSWSKDGQPWPYVELFPFIPTHEGMYRTNTERYERSRVRAGGTVQAARIPIEKTTARLLLLASDRDEVWASGNMTRQLVEQMVLAGKAEQVQVKIYPRAGHQLSGTGTFPVRLYGEQSNDPDAKDIIAEGEAAAECWKKTIAFLKK